MISTANVRGVMSNANRAYGSLPSTLLIRTGRRCSLTSGGACTGTSRCLDAACPGRSAGANAQPPEE